MKLIERFRQRIDARKMADSTADIYWKRITEFLKFHRRGGEWTHPDKLGCDEIEAWLAHLVTDRNFAESTQGQAFNAVLFLFREVLGVEIEGVDALRSRKPKNLPVVMTVEEVFRVLDYLDGRNLLIARLQYGTGMRRTEASRR